MYFLAVLIHSHHSHYIIFIIGIPANALHEQVPYIPQFIAGPFFMQRVINAV